MGEVVTNGSTWASFVFLTVILGLIAMLVWGALAAIGSRGSGSSPDPEQILRERLARGEIDEAEYRHLRALIRDEETERLR